jgi:hypothetical protein
MNTIYTDAKHLEILAKVLENLQYEVKTIKDLKKDCEGYILIFGRSWLSRSKYLSEKYNIGYIDTQLFSDIHKEYNHKQTHDIRKLDLNKLKLMVLYSIENTTYIKGTYTDTHVQNAININLDTPYLFNCWRSKLMLEKILSSSSLDSVYIESSAGTGKTRSIINYYEIMISAGVETLFFAVPTIEIMKQTFNDLDLKALKKLHVQKNEIYRLGDGMKTIYSNAKIIICTYDSLILAANIVHKSWVFIDEHDTTIRAKGYRKIMSVLPDLVRDANKTILLSATPNYSFCSGLHSSLNFKLVRCFPNVDNTPTIHGILHNFKTAQLPNLVLRTSEKYNRKNKPILIKYDNTPALMAMCEYYTKIGLKCLVLTSKHKHTVEYQRLMNNSVVGEIDVLLTTCLLESGVSIKQDFDVHILDVKNYAQSLQFKDTHIFCYQTTTTNNKKIAKKKERSAESATQFLKRNIDGATRAAKHINNKLKNKTFVQQDIDNEILTAGFGDVLTTLGTTVKIDIISLVTKIFNNRCASLTLSEMLERIVLQDKRFVNMGVSCVSFSCEDSEELTKLAEDKKTRRERIKELATTDLKNLCLAALKLGKGTKTQQEQLSGLYGDLSGINAILETIQNEGLNSTLLNKFVLIGSLVYTNNYKFAEVQKMISTEGYKKTIEQISTNAIIKNYRQYKKVVQGKQGVIDASKFIEFSIIENFKKHLHKEQKKALRRKDKAFLSSDKLKQLLESSALQIDDIAAHKFSHISKRKVHSLLNNFFEITHRKRTINGVRTIEYLLKAKRRK